MTGLRRAARITLEAWRGFRLHAGFDRAAAIAFYALLSLGPLLYLTAQILNLVWPAHALAGRLPEEVARLLPEALRPAWQRIQEELRFSGPGLGLALPALVWTAAAAFQSLEHALSTAFGALEQRRVWRAMGRAFLLAAAAALILTASVLIAEFGPWLRLRAWGAREPMRTLVRAGATVAALVVLYRFVPARGASWRAALWGALPAWGLWELARAGLSRGLRYSVSLGLLTGTLASVAVFLVWLYTAVAVVLLGAEIAARSERLT